MKHLDLFSGIGGFALAVDTVWPGAEHVFCEIDPFCQNVLRKHWPNAQIYGDIRSLTNTNSGRQTKQEQQATGNQQCGGGIDLLTGGFPCQPFSQAGKRKGKEDDRYLWPEMLRVIREFHPTWIIGENVAGIINMALEQVCLDLEGEGYEVQPFVIPACAVNAPHRRDRVWIIGHAKHNGKPTAKGTKKNCGDKSKVPSGEKLSVNEPARASGLRTKKTGRDTVVENPLSKRSRGRSKGDRQVLERKSPKIGNSRPNWPNWARNWQEVAVATCDVRVDDGLPKRLVRLPDGSTITEAKWRQQALKGYGNAIVPQVAIEIMSAIRDL